MQILVSIVVHVLVFAQLEQSDVYKRQDYVKTDSCDIVDELKKLQSEQTVYRGDKAESFLETIISNVSVATEKA